MEVERQISNSADLHLNMLGNVEDVFVLSVLINGVFLLKDETKKTHWRLDLNHYATKKSTAQSMLDVALLMANSSQLKTALQEGPEYRVHLITLIILSITLQVFVGFLLIFIVKHNLNDEKKQTKLNMLNNVATVFVLVILLVNVFITALGSDSGR